jgi:hypothetical protein
VVLPTLTAEASLSKSRPSLDVPLPHDHLLTPAAEIDPFGGGLETEAGFIEEITRPVCLWACLQKYNACAGRCAVAKPGTGGLCLASCVIAYNSCVTGCPR